jgi:hypothetical protein
MHLRFSFSVAVWTVTADRGSNGILAPVCSIAKRRLSIASRSRCTWPVPGAAGLDGTAILLLDEKLLLLSAGRVFVLKVAENQPLGKVDVQGEVIAVKHPDSVDGHLRPLAAGLGAPNLTFQSLRRTFATLMRGKGTPKDAQTQLRHKDILTALNVYTQPNRRALRCLPKHWIPNL